MNIRGWSTGAAPLGNYPIRWPWVIGILGPAAVNGLLGSRTRHLESEITDAVIAGEFIVLASWLAWGTGHFVSRLLSVWSCGALWCLASGLGVPLFGSEEESRTDLIAVPHVGAIALVCIAAPLGLLRAVTGWRLKLISAGHARASFRLWEIFVFLSMCAVILALLTAKPYWDWDNFFFVVLLVASLGFLAAPPIWAAFLGESLQLEYVALAVIAVSLAMSFWARVAARANLFFEMQPEYIAFGAAGGIVMLCQVLAAFGWRSLGYRLVCRGRTQRG